MLLKKNKILCKVFDKISIDIMSKYTDICELDTKLVNFKMVNYAKTKFKKIIITLIQPDTDKLIETFYNYNPYIIVVNSNKHLNFIKDFRKKIGRVKIGFYNYDDRLYFQRVWSKIF